MLRIAWYICLVIALSTIASNYIFYAYDFEKHSLWTALTAAFLKHIWGFSIGLVMLGLIQHLGWWLTDFFNYSAFRITGKISYATFMCHLFVLKLLMASSHQLMYVSDWSIVSFCALSFEKKLILLYFR